MQYAPYLSPARLGQESYHKGSIKGLAHGESPGALDVMRSGKILAPLVYLQNLPPPKRHPVDEEALMAFSPGLD